jgi:hypothetical protein
MSQFKGTYVFKQNGVEIGRSENLITDNGRRTILQFLSGIRGEWASDLAIGAINTTPQSSDLELNFETGRVPITLKSFKSKTDTNPDLIIVRATLPSTLYANIYEVGLYPQQVSQGPSARDNNILTDFSDLTNWVTSAGNVYITGFMPQVSNSPRIGAYSVDLDPSSTYYNSTFGFSMSGYSDIDNLQILAYNTVAGVATVTLTDYAGTSINVPFTLTDNADYQVLSSPFPSSVGSLGAIRTVSISTDSTASITIDCIKTSVVRELGAGDFIISKSVLDTPIGKAYGTTLDIEYYVQLN